MTVVPGFAKRDVKHGVGELGFAKTFRSVACSFSERSEN